MHLKAYLSMFGQKKHFKKGHLPMAVNIPFTDIMKEKFDIEADFNVEKEQPDFCVL